MTVENCPFCRSPHILVEETLGVWNAWCQMCRCVGPDAPDRDTAVRKWNNAERAKGRGGSNGKRDDGGASGAGSGDENP